MSDILKNEFKPEEIAPILGISAARIRKLMREGNLDLGLVIPSKPGGKTNNEYHIYRHKVEKIIGGKIEDVLTN